MARNYSAIEEESHAEPLSPENNSLLRPKNQNARFKYRAWIIGLVLLLIIGAAAVTIAVILTKKADSLSPFLLEDLFSGNYSVKRTGVSWISGGEDGDYISRKDGDFYRISVDGSSESLLLRKADIVDPRNTSVTISISGFIVAPSGKSILLYTNYSKVWRHSFNASYLSYDTETKALNWIAGGESLQLATFSDGGTQVAYVLEGDLYVSSYPYSSSERITFDGSKTLLNGINNWVYEEEVYSTGTASWFSPGDEASYVAFLKSDESKVPIFTFIRYEGGENAYQEFVDVPYPKSGYTNPSVDLWLYSIALNSSIVVSLPDLPSSADSAGEPVILFEVNWAGPSTLFVRVLDRIQIVEHIYKVIVSTANGSVETTATLVKKRSVEGGWIEVSSSLHFPSGYPEGEIYMDIVDVDGYDHLVLFNSSNSSDAGKPLTKGEWEVTSVLGVVDDAVYFIGTKYSSIDRHIYTVRLDGTGEIQSVTNEGPGYYTGSLSVDGGFLLINYEGPETPHQTIFATKDLSEVVKLQNNTLLTSSLSSFRLPTKRYYTINVNGYDMNVMELLPPNFSSSARYPLLFRVYGGPGSQLVNRRFGLDWHTYLASTHGYVVAIVDGRGTGFRGSKFRKEVYRNLGEKEAKDQVSAARYFADKDYIDESRIAIWGWSYGGYATAKVLELGSGLYATGISVAPVSDWRFYDSIYTERYMSTPKANPEGYTHSAVVNATNFKGTRYMIVHGSGDDNVHVQQGAVLSERLLLANVPHRFNVIPDNDHALNNFPSSTTILYKILTDFLLDNSDEELKVQE